MPHVIRLRGPWQCGGRTFDWEKELQVVLAADEAVLLSRNFGMPTGLGENDEVRLVIEGLRTTAVRLNGTALAGDFEITKLLKPRNLLEIECGPESTSAPQVRIEVHP